MKILIVDDHALFRNGLSLVLEALEENTIIFEASNSEQAIQYVSEHPDLDLVLLDLNMPGKDGFITLESFTKKYPALPIVIISASNQRSDIQRVLDDGAMGYIPKETESAVMLSALRLVLSGGVYVPPVLSQANGQYLKQQSANGTALTPRQLEVLAMLVHGHSNKAIAYDMNLSEATVKMHVTAIIKNLGVSNRTQAAMTAEKRGLCKGYLAKL